MFFFLVDCHWTGGGGAAASYRCTSWVWDTHSKLRDINLHHVTHSLISRNLREQMFIVRISLLIVTFLSFISRSLVTIVKLSEKSNPTHSHCAMCQHGECHLLLLLLLLLIMPLVECWSRIHVNITKLHNITCTLIAAGVMLRSLMSVYIYIYPVEVEDFWKLPIIEGDLWNIPQLNKEKPKGVVNM